MPLHLAQSYREDLGFVSECIHQNAVVDSALTGARRAIDHRVNKK